jgi:hypothetical protein
MCIRGSVLHERLAVASRAATSQLRVELLQRMRSELGDWYVSERWADRPLSELAIPIERGLIGFMDFEPRAECVRERRFGRGVPLAVDLGEQSRSDLWDLLSGRVWTR